MVADETIAPIEWIEELTPAGWVRWRWEEEHLCLWRLEVETAPAIVYDTEMETGQGEWSEPEIVAIAYRPHVGTGWSAGTWTRVEGRGLQLGEAMERASAAAIGGSR